MNNDNQKSGKTKGNPRKSEVVHSVENDIQTDSSIIIGEGDPNLSPDAGKPLI
jgi:hypothetical protein